MEEYVCACGSGYARAIAGKARVYELGVESVKSVYALGKFADAVFTAKLCLDFAQECIVAAMAMAWNFCCAAPGRLFTLVAFVSAAPQNMG